MADRLSGLASSGYVRPRRAVVRTLAAGGIALFMASCSSQGFNRFGGTTGGLATGPAASSQSAQPAGDVIGTGSVRVALLVPMSASGNAGAAAKTLRNAAQLAVGDFRNADIQIIVKDTQGTPAGAQAAAQAAIGDGAELVLGPLIASSVAAAAPIARSAGKPMIAFSTDASVAASGVYLLSFLPKSDIIRIVDFAARQGLRSHAALLPDTAYGTVVDGAFRQAAGQAGVRIVGIERYPQDANQLLAPVQRLAAAAAAADAILMPDGSATVATVSSVLSAQGIGPQSKKLLGSGQWDSVAFRQNPFLQGAWYPAPNPAGWINFRSRYQSTFGNAPARIATLSYDAVSLAAALTRAPAGQRYTNAVLTNPSGFSGIDGIFRFRQDGTNQRGLAIIEITAGGGTRIVDPAPTRFTGAGS